MQKWCIALCALLAAAVAVNAQIQVCDGNLKPGKVPAVSFQKGATAYESGYSSLAVSWPRPQDVASPGGINSCITEYLVEVYGRDGKKVQQGTVQATPAHTTATYTAKGLSAGAPYQFTATAKGPAGTGPTDIRSTPFTTAAGPPAPAPAPACKQPQSVSNIRKSDGGSVQGSKATMKIAWSPGTDVKQCVKEHVVTVYEAGSQTPLKTTTVPLPFTSYEDSIYTPGRAYEFFIYARNPSAGAMGNGVGLRSAPIQAPPIATPL